MANLLPFALALLLVEPPTGLSAVSAASSASAGISPIFLEIELEDAEEEGISWMSIRQ